jgi:hypothetical protein
MSAPSPQTYRVTVTATYSYKITLAARSEREAIVKAKRIWKRSGDERFIAFAGEAEEWCAVEETP